MCVQGAEIKTIRQEVPIQGQLTQKQPAPAPKPIENQLFGQTLIPNSESKY